MKYRFVIFQGGRGFGARDLPPSGPSLAILHAGHNNSWFDLDISLSGSELDKNNCIYFDRLFRYNLLSTIWRCIRTCVVYAYTCTRAKYKHRRYFMYKHNRCYIYKRGRCYICVSIYIGAVTCRSIDLGDLIYLS